MKPFVLKTKYQLKGLKGVYSLLDKKQELTRSIGKRVIFYIHWNMRERGGWKMWRRGGGFPAWKKLAFWTTVKRKMDNLGENPSDPLMVTKKMYHSWHLRSNRSNVTVYNTQPYAKYHEEGTRPHLIAAKEKPYLAFPYITERGRIHEHRKSPSEKRGIVFLKSVRHPGVVARPMLPPTRIAEAISQDVVNEYLKAAGVKVRTQAGRGGGADEPMGGPGLVPTLGFD